MDRLPEALLSYKIVYTWLGMVRSLLLLKHNFTANYTSKILVAHTFSVDSVICRNYVPNKIFGRFTFSFENQQTQNGTLKLPLALTAGSIFANI